MPSLLLFLSVLLFLSLFSAPVWAGLVSVDRSVPPIRDWAYEQLLSNRAQFAAASQSYKDGKLDECRATLVELHTKNPELPQPDLVIVWLQLSDHKLGLAKARLENLASAAPRDPQVALTLGQIALAENRLADAAAHLERTALLQLPEAWPIESRQAFAMTTLDTLAIAYERQSRWSDVKPLLTTLIGMGDKDLSYTSRLARAHYNLGESAQTEALLTKVADRSSGNLPAALLLADLAFTSGRLDEAGTAIQQAVALHPDKSEVQLWYAEWLLMQRDVQGAEQALAKAKLLGQSSARYWIALGQCRMGQSNCADAILAIRQAVEKLEPLNEPHRTAVATNLLALAIVCQAGSDQAGSDQAACQEALKMAEQNALAYSTDPTYVGTLGWIYFRLGRPAEAEPLLRRALELNSRVTADLSFFVADFYAKSNDKREIAQMFLKAALESTQGIFVLRPLAEKLNETLGHAK